MICRWYSNIHSPTAPTNALKEMKTNEKPSTKSRPPSAIRPRRADSRSAPDRPVA